MIDGLMLLASAMLVILGHILQLTLSLVAVVVFKVSFSS